MIILVEEEITETKQKQEAYLDVENLKTQFFTNRGIVKALDNVSFHINRGEIYGPVRTAQIPDILASCMTKS